jgi:hypothetical protein
MSGVATIGKPTPKAPCTKPANATAARATAIGRLNTVSGTGTAVLYLRARSALKKSNSTLPLSGKEVRWLKDRFTTSQAVVAFFAVAFLK